MPSDTEQAAAVVAPELLIGTPTLWWIGLVNDRFLAACAEIGITFFSVAFRWRKLIEHGDIIIVRAHDAAEIDAIFGGEASDDDESSENLDFASALMFQPWDLLSDAGLSMIVNTLEGRNIENMHGFKELPQEVQARVTKEMEHILRTGRVTALDHEDRLKIEAVEPSAEQQEAVDALYSVQEFEYREAIIGFDEYNCDACGLVRGRRPLTEDLFIEKMEALSGGEGVWQPGVFEPTEEASQIAITRAHVVLNELSKLNAPKADDTLVSASRKRVRDRDMEEVFNVVKKQK